ncbi:hypothetical protein COU75_03435 [Candidatus Peregrinibacteria bacterium CG10_big_fil_rev_8_21_14_0_10_42_8]|nr:MAG: hypothetical protein COU75_03435 [Candidatus Peregrinibacteria bacterium CG10_big_fil_rev_8_21_14_0_10_42_8]
MWWWFTTRFSFRFPSVKDGTEVKQSIYDDENLEIEVINGSMGRGQLNRVALVRKWKATRDQMIEFTTRWTEFRKEFLFDRVLLVIDADKDGEETDKVIMGMPDIPDWLCPVWVSGCGEGRSQLLNAGLLATTHMNPHSDCEVLCASFDAVARPGFGQAYADCDHSLPVPMIGIRCTLPQTHTQEMADFVNAFTTHGNEVFTLEQLSYTLEEYFTGAGRFPQKVLPVLKQFCRNTMQLWRLDALLKIGGFDLLCNDRGGQEDLLAFLTLMLRNRFDEFPLFYFCYDDSTVASKKQTYLLESQDEKGEREDRAVQLILSLLRNTYWTVGDPQEIGVQDPMFGLGH